MSRPAHLHRLPPRKSFTGKAVLLLAIFLSANLAFGQIKKYAATVAPVLGEPYTLFLNDYSTPGSNTLRANIVFNDFNEASWNFRLRIKIESNAIRLETREEFRPSNPITLAPGIARTISGADWEDYFNYNNLTISGTSMSQLVNSGGRLPEGLYSFCFQVIDYETGDPLSQEVCQTAWLKLMDPPRINQPACGNSLDPALSQHNFSWQMFNSVSPNSIEGNNYQLTCWEVIDPQASIQTAVANGQALQIFQSSPLSTNSYAYSLLDPQLEIGKRYVFRVQAIDPNGRDKFRNQGFSEFCSFYFGWPTGGKILLKFPAEGGGFRKSDVPYVVWESVTPKLPQQPVNYEIKIAPIKEGQTKEDAIVTNTPWFAQTTNPVFDNYDHAHEIREQRLAVMSKYAWQVKAFTNYLEVGKSKVSYFNGPPLMENFYAGVHRVQVDYLDGSNLDDISGAGKVRLSANSNLWTEIKFEHIKLERAGDLYAMMEGEIFYTPQSLAIELRPQLEENGTAFFDVQRFRINRNGISVEGNVRWSLPFPTLSTAKPSVQSEKAWADFNGFKISTAVRIAPDNTFSLLEPMNFKLNLSQSGVVYVYLGEYRFELNGSITLPSIVKGNSSEAVSLPFRRIKQLFYFEQDSIDVANDILPLRGSSLQLTAKSYVFDLSEKYSAGKFASDLAWKGVYLKTFNLNFYNSLDKKGQLDVVSRYAHTVLSSNDNVAFITSNGLGLKCDVRPDTVPIRFQTFPSFLERFVLEVDRNQVVGDHSFLKGKFVLPVVDEAEFFHFTVPINDLGFADGSLDDLVNKRFTINKGGGDQEINVDIKRAVLSASEKITMNIDVQWPSLGVTLSNLNGFNAWGDHSIGFDRKNGTVPLTQRYNATMSGYAVTISVIGAASNDGHYAFATTADAGLGDDVSGGESAPTINLYSMWKNKFVPKGGGDVGPANIPQISLAQGTQNISAEYGKLQENLASRLDADQQKILDEARGLRDNVSAGFGGVAYTAENILGDTPQVLTDGVSDDKLTKYRSRQRQRLHSIAEGFVQEIAKPILQPIKNKTDSLNLAVRKAVGSFIAQTESRVQRSIEIIVKSVATSLKSALANPKVNIGPPIDRMADETIRIVTAEIITSLKISAENNICQPISILLVDQVNARINRHIVVNGTEAVYAMLNGDGSDAGQSLLAIAEGAPSVLRDIIKDVAGFVNPDHIKSTIEATASDFIKNVSIDDIGHDLRNAAGEILTEAVKNEINKAVSNLASSYAQDAGLGSLGINGDTPIDFVGVAQRFSKDGIKGVFNVDKVLVKLKTPVIDLDGYMNYTPKHPVYGSVWVGDIDMTIKVPKRFAFNAIYFNGKKDDISYWFCQITPPNGSNNRYELGKPLPKTAKKLDDPVDLGLVQLVAASGRLYHHMSETPGNGIVPDAAMKYGAYMHFVLFDKSNKGKNMRLEVSGEINTKENGDYTIAFDGNLQIQSPAPDILNIDKTAAVQGTVIVRYNSAEEHFFGYAKVIVDNKSLCAQASLLVDVKPGKWRVAIGTREERIIFVPGCAGWSPTGWLDLNQNTAELGLGLQYSGTATSPKLNLGIIGFWVEMDAGIAAGILADVQYNPKFQLMKAGIWVDIWANIIAHYKFGLGANWKSITLVEIYIRGDLVLIFNPPPTLLEGKLNGRVSVIGMSFNFNANLKKQL
jgi:hypothetical protein